MNIKSLLLGSAAALLAVSGVRAADAVVVAEPEPAEYVKICDVYGAGYFYIPGTETCLRIGGHVRYDMGVGDLAGVGVSNVPDHMGDGSNDSYWKRARFSLRTWTGEETELGTLKTYTETRFSFGNSAKDYDGSASTDWQARNLAVTLNHAWIQLGGLRVGKSETAYDTFVNYAGNVINDTVILYGVKDTNLISYYFGSSKDGFSGVISLEEGSESGVGGSNTIDSYVPHVVGGVKYKADWGSISAVGAYNSVWEEWAGKVRLDVKATKDLSLFLLVGYGTDNNSSVNQYKPWDGNWALWAGGSYEINKKLEFNTQVSWDDASDFSLAVNVAYDVVPGLAVIPELVYYNNFDVDNSDAFGGMIRIQRDF